MEPLHPPARRVCPTSRCWPKYVGDLSFENPGVATSLTDRPQIELAVDLNAARMAEKDHFEAELKIRVDAKSDGKPLFLLEVAYAGIFRLTNVPDTGTQQMILLIQAPHMLFPFVRRIVPRTVRCATAACRP